ncbi:MAG: DUF5688 family protein [Lachnospiraceae bacterium]|nr:DUF5688 family protein [Lachnospiraceae bacterium]
MKSAVFEEKLIHTLIARSEEELCISGDWIPVNNQPRVRVLKLQKEDCRLMPLVYPRDYEERFEEGETVETLADEILSNIQKAQELPGIPLDFFEDYQAVRERIYCKVISADKNRELLNCVPCEYHEDLAIVYYFEFPKDTMEGATILIRNEHLELWDCSAEEISSKAWRNTLAVKKTRFMKLSQVLAGFGLEETEEMEQNPLYMLSNEDGSFGAAVAFYPGVLAKCALQLGSNLILLPCSIHEWLLIPSGAAEASKRAEELRCMVRDINRTQVAEKEVLSDEVYYYDLETDQIRVL